MKNSDFDWKALTELNENEILALRSLGYSYLEQGQIDSSLIIFEGLTVLDRNNAYNHQMTGALHLEKGLYHEALTELSEAGKINPDEENVLINELKTLFSLGYFSVGKNRARKLLLHPNEQVQKTASLLLSLHT